MRLIWWKAPFTLDVELLYFRGRRMEYSLNALPVGEIGIETTGLDREACARVVRDDDVASVIQEPIVSGPNPPKSLSADHDFRALTLTKRWPR